MENTTQQTVNPPVTEPLVRPRNGRVISGAALGLALKLGVSSTLVRVAWVLLAFTGIGIPAYLLAWLLIPTEGEQQSIGEQWMARLGSTQGWIGVVLVVIAIAVLAPALPFIDGGILIPTILLAVGILLYQQNFSRAPSAERPNVPRASAPPARPKTPPSPLGQITLGASVISLGVLALVDRATPTIEATPRHYLALAATMLGLGVLVGTFYGRARWLVPFALLLVPATAIAAVVEYGTTAEDRTFAPTAFAELQSLYELPAGELTIDLTGLPWNGETVSFDAEVGVGRLELILPGDVGIDAQTEVGIGASRNPVNTQGGLGIDFDYQTEAATGSLVATNLEVGIGEIEVRGSGFGGLFEDGRLTLDGSGDLILEPTSGASVADSYSATGDGDLTLDLTGWEVEDERFLNLTSDDGDIVLVLPQEASYSISAHGPDINFDGREVSGTFVTESHSPGQPILHVEVASVSGAITIEKGTRS